jgi:transmembrane sensor
VSISSRDQASLFKHLTEGTLSPGEITTLIEWLGSSELDPATKALLLQQLQKSVNNNEVNPETIAALEARLPHILANATARRHRARVIRVRWMRYAAAMVVCIGIAAYFTLFNRSSKTTANNTPLAVTTDIGPGKDGAILTLADGSTIVLDSMGNGLVTDQVGAQVVLRDGKLVYDASDSRLPSKDARPTYNTITTPKGRQFRLLLQDGTSVWLNAASSLRFPTVFTGKERRVEVTGEAYFEVASLPLTLPTGGEGMKSNPHASHGKMPFIVNVHGKVEVEVLGTHFNINAYEDEESIKTTLLEGTVKVSATQPQTTNHKQQTVLKPGEQAITTNYKLQTTNNINVDQIMAWKNGVFNFEDAKLHEVMRQLERWYDIEVIYEKGVPEIEFMGKMGRDLTLMEVLRGLQMSKVHCRIAEGRKLIVMP